MLSDVRPDVMWGDDAERLVALATASAERLLRKLLVEALAMWAALGFDRFDDREISFTLRLHATMLAIKELNRGEMLMMHAQYDGPLPTRDMLLGLADPGRTPRPDLTVRCGDALVPIEAKRLMPAQGLPRKYVKDGMMRFLDGRYIASGGNAALMLGYVMRGEPTECYEAVNDVIRGFPGLGPEEVAKQREALDVASIYVSEHSIGEITHYAIDVRDRCPSFLESRGVVKEWGGEDPS